MKLECNHTDFLTEVIKSMAIIGSCLASKSVEERIFRVAAHDGFILLRKAG